MCRGGGLGREAAMKRMQMKVRIKFLKKTNLGWLKLYLATRVRTTGKNNRFPLLDILGYYRIPIKISIWQSETSPN